MKALILDGTKSSNNESTKIFDLMVEELETNKDLR